MGGAAGPLLHPAGSRVRWRPRRAIMGPAPHQSPMNLDPKTILQILVLAVGAHIVLSFLRTTRGSGLVRGVMIALVVVFGGLLGIARWLELAELRFILETLTGFVVVILAIVFQPELRRGIVSLGDNPLLRTVMGSRTGDTADEVAAACVAMGKRKQGALIAFERQVALDAWTQKAVRIDARVSRHLLESVFHPGGALHDGAVILREGRIAAAMAILPLSEKDNLARSIGTRHRAALGLTEETDALVVAVSEETGLITICQDGVMERKVLRDELAEELRARLGGEESSARRAGPWSRISGAAFGNLGQKAFALLLGIAMFYAAFRSVRTEQDFSVEVRVARGEEASVTPVAGVLTVLLPTEDAYLRAPLRGSTLSVNASAAQATLGSLAGGIGGVLVVKEEWIGPEREIDVDAIRWGSGGFLDDLDVRVEGRGSLPLTVDRLATARITPDPALFIQESDEGPPQPAGLEAAGGLEVVLSSLEFSPTSVQVRGRAEAIARLQAGGTTLAFRPITLPEDSGSGFVVALELDRARMNGVELTEDLFLRGRLRAPETTLFQIELDVALSSLAPEEPLLAQAYDAPTNKVTVRVRGSRLVPPELLEDAKIQRRQELLGFVRKEARAFVDLSKIDPSVSLRASVELTELPDWRTRLGAGFESARKDPLASLRLELDEEDRTLELRPR